MRRIAASAPNPQLEGLCRKSGCELRNRDTSAALVHEHVNTTIDKSFAALRPRADRIRSWQRRNGQLHRPSGISHHCRERCSMIAKMKAFALAGAIVASGFAATGASAAGWMVGLVDGKSIVTIDPASWKVTSKVDIKGSGPLLGIDVRPADGMLYGVAADGAIVTVDVKTGQATMKSKMSESLKPDV